MKLQLSMAAVAVWLHAMPDVLAAEPPGSKEALFDLAIEKEGDAKVKPKADLPLTRDALFADMPSDVKSEAFREGVGGDVPSDGLPASKDALFDEPPATAKAAHTSGQAVKLQARQTKRQVKGYLQTELARTYAGASHWSKAIGRLELGTQGDFQGGQWKLSGRVDYNAVFEWSNFYQPQVRDDQRAEFHVRESYLDFSAGGLEWRLGRQHIVWGELVGMFLADVVSAKDMREFLLPDFQVMRIPQWAVRAEYFGDDYYTELLWIPFPSYDEIGRPANSGLPGSGADFYPYPPVPGVPTFLKEDKPDIRLGHTNFGARLGRLKDGWDVSGFYYTSMNAQASYYQVAPGTYQPRHDRIWQLGGSVAKDLGPMVMKAEAVYTHGRRFNLVTTGDAVAQQMLDWAVGLDFNPDADTLVNTQFFQSRIFDHNANVLPDAVENGVSFYVSRDLPNKWRAELLLMRSLNRADWLARPKLSWKFRPDWKLTLGVDIFSGPVTGYFGQYDDKDRAYAEVRYAF